MKIKTTKRMVEIEDKTYIAEDGEEFATYADCLKYEQELEEEKLEEEVKMFEIIELEDTYPLDTDAQYISDDHGFNWYKVNNKDEWEAITKFYNTDSYSPRTYPEIVCIEHNRHYGRDVWIHLLSDMKEATILFWKKHGFDVDFLKIQD